MACGRCVCGLLGVSCVAVLGRNVTEQDWRVIALVGLPVVAAVCLGMIIRAFVDYEGDYWWL